MHAVRMCEEKRMIIGIYLSSEHPTIHFHVTSKNVNKRIKILYFLLNFSSLIFKGRMYLVTKARFYEPTFFSLTKTL